MITNSYLKKGYITTIVAGFLLITAIAFMVIFYKPDYYKGQSLSFKNLNDTFITGNTMRIYGKDFYETAAAISQAAYPATFDYDKPNAVILVRGDKELDAIMAASIIHHPVNAPILYTDKDKLPEVTWNEMKRLDPKGISADNNVKVILAGDIGERVETKVRGIGWKFRSINGDDPFTLGKNINDYLEALNGKREDTFMIASAEAPEYALAQTAWNAREGDGLFFVEKDSIPEPTIKGLAKGNKKINIYILGSRKEISNKVETELAKYGHTQRIPGSGSIFSQAVGFAEYRDQRKNTGWWIGESIRNFGWGISSPGHNFIFVNSSDWQSSAAASILSYRGKHGPQLMVENNRLPEEVTSYLKTIKPSLNTSWNQLYNHGLIIGSPDSISYQIQAELDRLLGFERGDDGGSKQ